MAFEDINFKEDRLNGFENFDWWSFRLKLALGEANLQDCVQRDENGDVKEKDANKLIRAKAMLVLSVEPCIYLHILSCTTAMEIWTKLHEMFACKSIGQRVSLFRELQSTKLEPSDTMNSYITKMNSITRKFLWAGFALNDETIANYLLSGLSSEYNNFIVSLKDERLTLDEIKEKLLHEAKNHETPVSTEELCQKRLRSSPEPEFKKKNKS